MHMLVVEVDEHEEPYLRARPRTYGECVVRGLGTTRPCPHASCRHSLLSDEMKGQTHGDDVDLETVETCSLAVAGRGPHSSVEISRLTVFCESSVEEWVRRGVRAVKEGLGISEFNWPPQNHGYKLQSTETDGLTVLVENLFRRGLPPLKTPPVRHLSRAEAEQLYPGKVSERYGEGKGARGAGAVPDQPPSENGQKGAA
jgi:hypothetical protein